MKYCHIQLALFVSLLALLSTALTACSASHQTEFSHLQNEFSQYKQSDFVNESLNSDSINLKTDSLIKISKNEPKSSYKVANGSARDKTSHRQSQQTTLTLRKNTAASGLTKVIQNNGLYPSTTGLSVATPKTGKLDSRLSNSRLSTVLEYVLIHNQEIKTSLKNAQASLEKYDQVDYLDDMLEQYTAFNRETELPGSSNQKQKQPVTTGFPYPGLRSLKASIVDQEVETARLKLKQTVQDVITQTRVAYHELQYSQREIKIKRETLSLLRVLKKELEDSYSTSTSSQTSTNKTGLTELLQMDIEIDKAKNNLQIAQNQNESQQAKLNALLNLAAGHVFDTTLDKLKKPQLDFSSAQLISIAQQKRVEIEILQSELSKMARIIRLSEKRFYPDFSAGYSLNSNPSDRNSNAPQALLRRGMKNNAFFAQNDAYLRETKTKYKALQSQLEALKINTKEQLQQTLLQFQIENKKRQMYQSGILPKSRSNLDLTKNLYETGETSYLDVVNAQKMILDYQLLSTKAIKEMNIHAARLARFSGQHF